MSDNSTNKGGTIIFRVNADDLAKMKAFCGSRPLGPHVRATYLRVIEGYRRDRHPTFEELEHFKMQVLGIIAKGKFPEAARNLSSAVQEGHTELDDMGRILLFDACTSIIHLRKEFTRLPRIKDDSES